jgi:hypothetical protein
MRSHKKRLERLERLFGIRRGMTVIFAQPGETGEEARQRVYAQNPGAQNAALEVIFENPDPPANPQGRTINGAHPPTGRPPGSPNQGKEGVSGGKGELSKRVAPRVLDQNLPFQVLEGCYMQFGRRFAKDTLEEMYLGPPRVPSEVIRGMPYDYLKWQGQEYLVQNGWLFDPKSGCRVDPIPCPSNPGAIMITH